MKQRLDENQIPASRPMDQLELHWFKVNNDDTAMVGSVRGISKIQIIAIVVP